MKHSTSERAGNHTFRYICLIIFICIFFAWPDFHVQAASPDKWTSLKQDFAGDDQVDRLIFVKYKNRSRADFFMYRKTDRGSWKKLFRCSAWVGKKGIGKKREGDSLPIIVIRGIGDCGIETIPGGEFEAWLRDGGAV